MRDAKGRQYYQAVGGADDARDSDGLTAFTYSEAQDRARVFFHAKAREFAGDAAPADHNYTVADALSDYFLEREQRSSKGVRADKYAANAHIIPSLGEIETRHLTSSRIRQWRHSLETSPKHRRSVTIDADQPLNASPLNDDAKRARKATSNRHLTILKACLNFAYASGKTPTDEAWRKVKAHREVDAPIIRYLLPSECVRLVNAAGGSFRTLIRGALLTGARYGELGRMRVEDFNVGSGTVTVRVSKAGRSRHIALNDEGRRLFERLIAGKQKRELIFTRDDGRCWGASHQQRPIEEASRHARIDPAVTFHVLRHTYASALAMKGVPMRVIADQLGHADTRITERHYAHLSSSYVADVVRAALPEFGILGEADPVTLLRVG